MPCIAQDPGTSLDKRTQQSQANNPNNQAAAGTAHVTRRRSLRSPFRLTDEGAGRGHLARPCRRPQRTFCCLWRLMGRNLLLGSQLAALGSPGTGQTPGTRTGGAGCRHLQAPPAGLGLGLPWAFASLPFPQVYSQTSRSHPGKAQQESLTEQCSATPLSMEVTAHVTGVRLMKWKGQ